MDWAHLGTMAAGLVFEAWLGKTDKVKAASTLELVANGAAFVAKKIMGTQTPTGGK